MLSQDPNNINAKINNPEKLKVRIKSIIKIALGISWNPLKYPIPAIKSIVPIKFALKIFPISMRLV